MAAPQALEKLLLSLFSADELRRWLRYLPGGDAISGELPGANASPAALASEAVHLLERSGMLDADFWERLVAERPRRKPDIDQVRGLFDGKLAVPPVAAASVVTVLLVSASPDSAVRLRVDREFRDVIARMRGTEHRARFNFVQLQAARFDDLRTALQVHKPQILHISSHGKEDGSLVLEGKDDEPQSVSKAQLQRLLKALKFNLKLLVFNACHSQAVVTDLTGIVDLAIGMSDAVADDAAIEFSVAFYESLGFANPVENAFEVALAGLDEIDVEIPQLFPPADADPQHKRHMVLV